MRKDQDVKLLQGCGMLVMLSWLYVATILWMIFDTASRPMAMCFLAGLLTKTMMDTTISIMKKKTGLEYICSKCNHPVLAIHNYCCECGEDLNKNE